MNPTLFAVDENGELYGAVLPLNQKSQGFTDSLTDPPPSKLKSFAKAEQNDGKASREVIIDLTDDSALALAIEGDTGATKYKKIAQYILNVLGNEKIILSDGKQAIVDKSDALHIANRAASKKTAQISKIKEIVQEAKLYAQAENIIHKKFRSFYYYKANVRYDGDVFPIYVNVGKANNDNSYHIYDITNKIRDTADRINGLERPKPNEGYALTNGISNNSISQNDDLSTQNSKNNFEGKASRELDAEYLSAVERGDMLTAQRMVDEAAKNWGAVTNDKGKVTKFYHGTKAKFNEFKEARSNGWLGKGIYFTDNKKYAKQYGKKVLSVYLNSDKVYVSKENDHFNVFSELQQKYPQINDFNITKGLKEAGYKGIMYLDWDTDRGLIVSVFSPEQIKSADPVTYDDDGNVIPLSERFNAESKDIRYSREIDVLDYITPEGELEGVDEMGFSNRELLASALLDTVTGSEEYKLIRSYQEEIAGLDKSDKRLQQLKKDRAQLYKQKNPNFEVIGELNEKIKALEGEIVKRDKRLLRLESTTALKKIKTFLCEKRQKTLKKL